MFLLLNRLACLIITSNANGQSYRYTCVGVYEGTMGWGKNDAADDEEYMCEDGWGKIPGIIMMKNAMGKRM